MIYLIYLCNAARSSYLSCTIKNSVCRPKSLFAMVKNLTNPSQHVISGSEMLVNDYSIIILFIFFRLKSITESIIRDTTLISGLNVKFLTVHPTNSLSAFPLTTATAISDRIVKSLSCTYCLT